MTEEAEAETAEAEPEGSRRVRGSNSDVRYIAMMVRRFMETLSACEQKNLKAPHAMRSVIETARENENIIDMAGRKLFVLVFNHFEKFLQLFSVQLVIFDKLRYH